MSPRVGHARYLLHAWRLSRLCRNKKRFEAGVPIDLQFSCELRQVLLGILPIPTRGISIPDRRWIGRPPCGPISNISPDVAASGLAGSRSENPKRGIVGVDVVSRQSIFSQRRNQRTQQKTTRGDPLHECCARDLQSRVRENLALPVEWKMEAVLPR